MRKYKKSTRNEEKAVETLRELNCTREKTLFLMYLTYFDKQYKATMFVIKE